PVTVATVVAAWDTLKFVVGELLSKRLPSPLYATDTLWLPIVSPLMLKDALPLPSRPMAADEVEPTVKTTDPPGVPLPGALAVTVAVNVTDCPNTGAVGATPTVTTLLALFTVSGKMAEVLAVKLPSP